MIQEVAQQVSEIQRSYEQGIISADEFKELIDNIGALQAIHHASASLEENIMYRTIIVNAINLASSLA